MNIHSFAMFQEKQFLIVFSQLRYNDPEPILLKSPKLLNSPTYLSQLLQLSGYYTDKVTESTWRGGNSFAHTHRPCFLRKFSLLGLSLAPERSGGKSRFVPGPFVQGRRLGTIAVQRHPQPDIQ